MFSLTLLPHVLSTEGTDFTLDTSNFNFAMGAVNSQTINILVTPINDTDVEGTENYVLSIVVNSGPATVGTATVTVDILDDDGKLLL